MVCLFWLEGLAKMSTVGFYLNSLNSLAAIDGHDRQFFDKLLWGLVTSTIFVRC
jgi:hypothetical protein